MSWVADKSGANQTDRPYDHYNRTNAGDPTNTLAPSFAGERVMDTTNGTLYQALGTVSSTWVVVAKSGRR